MVFQDIILELKEYLDWNRYMTLGLSFWGLLVAVVVDADATIAQCTHAFPFPGVIWIAGLVLIVTTCTAEFLTDVRSKDDAHKQEVKYPFMPTKKAYPPTKITWTSIILRLVSNLLLFYTIVATTSYGWFPVGGTCFVSWTQKVKDWSLGSTGIAAVLALILRISLFDYITIAPPQTTGETLINMTVAITAALEATRRQKHLLQGPPSPQGPSAIQGAPGPGASMNDHTSMVNIASSAAMAALKAADAAALQATREADCGVWKRNK